MKRRTVLASIAAASLLAACGSGSTAESTSTASGTAAAGDVSGEITYAYWDVNFQPVMNDVVKAFQAKYPKVKVSTQISPWDQFWTKMQTQAESKTLPDVFWMSPINISLYASNGVLQPMDSLISSGAVDTSKYPKALVEANTFDGKVYAVPRDVDTVALAINKKLFQQAGVKVPTQAMSWAEFKTTAKTISDKLKSQGVFGVTTALDAGQASYYNTIPQAGGHVISADGKKSGYDDPKTIAGLQFWRDLIASGSMPTIQQLADTKAHLFFTNGKAAMMYAPTWTIAELDKSKVKADATYIEIPYGEQKATVSAGVTNVVAADSKNMAAAQAFQAFVSGPEAAEILAKSGLAMPAYSGMQKAWVASKPTFNLQAFVNELDYAVAYPTSKNTAAWSQYEADLLKGFSGATPMPDVAKAVAEKMNAALAKE